jgi:hypothetical protein
LRLITTSNFNPPSGFRSTYSGPTLICHRETTC